MDRRTFIKTSAVLLCCSCAETAPAVIPMDGPINAGSSSQYQVDGIYDRFASQGFFLSSKNGRLCAVSSVCSHKGGALRFADGAIRCTKHIGVFNYDGDPISGPPIIPLVRYQIWLDDLQNVLVDMSSEYRQDSWGRPGASVTLY